MNSNTPFVELRTQQGSSIFIINTGYVDTGGQIRPEDRLDGARTLLWQDNRVEIFLYRYRGRCARMNRMAAVKVLRGAPHDLNSAAHKDRCLALLEACCKWMQLLRDVDKPPDVHIAELFGITYNIGSLFPAAATKYYRGGNISEYTRINQNLDLLPLLRQGAVALKFVHSRNVIHGHVRGSNFLVDENGKVYLTDIGLYHALTPPGETISKSWRWWPFTVEYMDDDKPLNFTKSVDVHAFGMTMVEVYSRGLPFPEYTDGLRTVANLGLRGFPTLRQPDGMPRAVWDLVRDCTGRGRIQPDMSEVEQRLTLLCDT